MLGEFEKKSLARMKELGFNEQFIKEMEKNEGYGDMPGIEHIEQFANDPKTDVKNYEDCQFFYYWATYL